MKIDMKSAALKLINEVELPEEQLEQLYLEQEQESKLPAVLNILLFVFGMFLLFYGVLRTYEFASQKNPNESVRERMYRNERVR